MPRFMIAILVLVVVGVLVQLTANSPTFSAPRGTLTPPEQTAFAQTATTEAATATVQSTNDTAQALLTQTAQAATQTAQARQFVELPPGTMGTRGWLPIARYPKPLPSNTVQVLSSRGVYSSFGRSYYVYGEIMNTLSVPVYFAEVEAKFFDAAGTFVATDSSDVKFSRVNPGQKSSFIIILSNAPSGIVRYDLSVNYRTSSIFDYRPITVLSIQIRDNSGPEVFGEVRNDQTVPLTFVKVVVTFYDAYDNVVFVDYTYATVDTLAPGATSTYRISTSDKTFTYTSFSVIAEGDI